MPQSPSHKHFAAQTPELARYVADVFGPEDDLLADVRQRAAAAGLPAIHVSPFDGRHLEVLARACGARRIVEIGTLAGYSGVCLARALPDDGVLHTFEFDPKHAQVARESFRKAGLGRKVVIHVGPALDKLPTIESQGPFDMVFIDADKENYPRYLEWAARNLRVGGLALADNAFAWGLLALPEDAAELAQGRNRAAWRAIHEVNAAPGARHNGWCGTMLPTGEGLAMGVRVR